MRSIPQPQADPNRSAPLRVPLSADEPGTLVEVYERAVRLHPKPDTLNYKSDGAWQTISADEMLKRARRLALGLYSLGVRKGDRLALLSESRVEWVLADQGCIFAGMVENAKDAMLQYMERYLRNKRNRIELVIRLVDSDEDSDANVPESGKGNFWSGRTLSFKRAGEFSSCTAQDLLARGQITGTNILTPLVANIPLASQATSSIIGRRIARTRAPPEPLTTREKQGFSV